MEREGGLICTWWVSKASPFGSIGALRDNPPYRPPAQWATYPAQGVGFISSVPCNPPGVSVLLSPEGGEGLS